MAEGGEGRGEREGGRGGGGDWAILVLECAIADGSGEMRPCEAAGDERSFSTVGSMDLPLMLPLGSATVCVGSVVGDDRE